MLLPVLLYFIIFRYGPIFGVTIAFQEFIPRPGQSFFQSIRTSEWVGLTHFIKFFSNPMRIQVLYNTVIISAYKIIFGFPAPIILALMLNEINSQRFKRIAQTITYLPHFISWIILSGILRLILSPDFGVIVPVFKILKMDTVNFLGDAKYFRGLLVVTDIWQSIGWGSIIYLAAISGIDHQIYEAATIDGAGRFRKLLHITLPSIASTIVIMFILRTGKIMRAGFDQVFNLYNPAVYKVADILETYIYRVGLIQNQFSYTSAVGLFQSLIGFIMVLIANYLAKMLGQEGIW